MVEKPFHHADTIHGGLVRPKLPAVEPSQKGIAGTHHIDARQKTYEGGRRSLPACDLQRKLGYFLLPNRALDRGCLVVQWRGGGGHLDGLPCLAQPKRYRDAHSFVEMNEDPCLREGLEALRLNLEPIGGLGQVRQSVRTVRAADSLPNGAHTLCAHGHFGARNDSPGGIRYRTADRRV